MSVGSAVAMPAQAIMHLRQSAGVQPLCLPDLAACSGAACAIIFTQSAMPIDMGADGIGFGPCAAEAALCPVTPSSATASRREMSRRTIDATCLRPAAEVKMIRVTEALA